LDKYLDRILGGDGQPRYNIVRENGTIVETNIRLVQVNEILQDGTPFGAKEVNSLLIIDNNTPIVDLKMEAY